MSNLVTFSGSSDDLIEVTGSIHGCDEYTGEHDTFAIGGAGLVVKVDYGDNGCWDITVGQVDENVAVKVASNGYSMCLSLTLPDDCFITRVSE